MPFLRPASPNPLQLPSSPMDSSPMDFTSSPTMTNPNTNSTSSGFTFANPLSRIIHSPTPTPAHLRSRTRRPSSLSLGFDRIKPFGFGTSSSSSPSSGGPNGANGMAPSSASSGGSTNNMGMNITANTNANPAPTVLQPAPTIFDLDPIHNNGRGRASSTASSMSFSFSPSRRSVSLEDNPHGGGNMDENEETPNANSNRRRSNRLSNLSSLKRKRQVIGISGQNESESSLSNASNGRNTPDMTLHTPSGIGAGFGMPRGIEDDVDALAMDFAGTGSQPSSSPNKEMTLTPPRGTVPLADVSPFATKGALKPARLLRIQNELTAPFLDGETRSEAAFTRLVASTSDLASRLRLTTSTPSSSPARGKRQQNRWMANWAASNANGAGNGIGGGDNLGGSFGGGGSGSVLANGGAGRFPESVNGDGEGAVVSDETDSDGDGVGEATFVISRPSSGLGHASGAISIPMGMGGRSRSGSGIMGDAMMMIGSYGASAEMGDGGMDLDMVSNMSSPVSTPAATSWREPAPFFQSKKRKFSAAVDAERLDLQPQVKKRKGMSPHGTSIPLSASSSSSPFNFPQPRSPHQSFQGVNQLSMTSISSVANANQMSSHNYFSPFGAPFSAASAPGPSNPNPNLNGNGNGNGGGTALGMTGLGGGTSTGNGHHHHRKSGSISTMAWSRPGSTHSSPLLRPSSGQGNTGASMPAPPGMLLGPSMLSISSTLSASAGVSNGSNMNGANGNGNPNPGPFNFNFSAARGGGGGGGSGQGGMSSPAFQQYPNMALGEFGAPLTASPSNRPMMKLPERALHAMGAAAATSGGSSGNTGSG